MKTHLLGQLLASSASRWPAQAALAFPGQRLSYSELYRGALLRAQALEQCGVSRNEHVGILMPNSTDFLLWMFGCALHGSIAVLVNARYKSSELAFVIHDANLVCLVTRSETKSHLNYSALLLETLPELSTLAPDATLKSAPLLRQIILCGNGQVPETALFIAESIVLEQAADNSALVGPASPESPCLMLYTSGTTSHPKGCVLGHRMLTTKAAAIVERLAFRADDRQWNPLPLFHLASLLPMLASFATGGLYMSDSHFDSERAWEQILNEQATILYPAFPTVMSELVTHPRFAELDTRQVRLINNVAPPDRLRENMRLLPHTVHISAYGLTEGTGISCFSNLDDDDQTRAISIGQPLSDTHLRIADPQSGTLRAVDEQGEIQLAGPSVFTGYYQAPKASTEAFTADGWFRTGDIGSLDSSGRLAYHGRLKEMLKVGGENVSALEIESILCTHPAIKMVQVVGVPDRRLEEVVAAFVELNLGANVDTESLIAYCRERLASFKVPRYVRVVSEWPMSSTKVQKFRLRDNLIAELDGRA